MVIKLAAYPVLRDGKWTYVVSQKSPGVDEAIVPATPKGTRGNAKALLTQQITALVTAGHVVHAQITDQTGGGHSKTYTPHPSGDIQRSTQGPDVVIPAKGNLLGPRCIDLPRGTKKTDPGRPEAAARRKTISSTRMWADLVTAVKDGVVAVNPEKKTVKRVDAGATVKAPWIRVAPNMFRALAMPAVYESWHGVGTFGRFPIYDGDIDGIPKKQLDRADIKVGTAPASAKPPRAVKPEEAAPVTKPPRTPRPPRTPAAPAAPAAPAPAAPVQAGPAKPPRPPRAPRPPAAPAPAPAPVQATAPVARPPRTPRTTRPPQSPQPTALVPAAPAAPAAGGMANLISGLMTQMLFAPDSAQASAPSASRRYAPPRKGW